MGAKSPFPGMDPFLELHWGDVHHSLAVYARDQLQPALPADLRARAEERVYIAAEGEDGAIRRPDVLVRERAGTMQSSPPASGGLAVASEPLIIRLDAEPVTEIFIEIIDVASGNRVVTVIEFLSPTNKLPGDGRDQYVQKRRQYKEAGANLVEIDLTRQGVRSEVMPVRYLPLDQRDANYLAWVQRGAKKMQLEVYSFSLREPLKAIKIPLRESDPDAVLDLQALVEQAYLNGGYDDLNYRRDLVPKLPPADEAWAYELLARAGKR